MQQRAYKLSSSLSECTTLPKLSRTLLNPLVSFDQSIHSYSTKFLVNFEFGACAGFNLHILKVFELSRDTCSRPLTLPSLSPLNLLGAAQAKVRSETLLFSGIFSIPFREFILVWHLTLSVKRYKLPIYFRIELVQGYYYICDHYTTPSKIYLTLVVTG